MRPTRPPGSADHQAVDEAFLRRPSPTELAVDLDSSLVVHANQPGRAYNGHYGVRFHHPPVAHLADGVFWCARWREGNARIADGGLDSSLLPTLEG